MRGIGSIFAVLAFALAAPFVTGTGPAGAAEPSKKHLELQAEAVRLSQAGSHQQALALAKQALALAVEEFGPDSRQADMEAYGVGGLAEAAGDFAGAAHLYSNSVRVRETLYGRESPLVAITLERLGAVLVKLGRYAEAEARFSREIQIHRDFFGEDAVPAGAYSGLGAVNLARGDSGAALSNYRKAVHRLTSRRGGRTADRSNVEDTIKEHRDAFIGLGRAAAAQRLKPGADEPRLMEESFAAGQGAWATSASAALAKTTARLKAGETELGRAIRRLDTLDGRIQELRQQLMDEAKDQFTSQQANPEFRQMMDTFMAVGAAQMKDMAPMMKHQRELVPLSRRQQELSGRLQAIVKRCPTAAMPGCAGSDRERMAITKELSELGAKIAQGAREPTPQARKEMARDFGQISAAMKRAPAFMALAKSMKGRQEESRRLEKEFDATRSDVVKRFPEYLSIAEPAPSTVAETQKLLKNDEALVAILTGPESSMAWVVTPGGADWAEIGAGDAALAAEVKALRAGLEPTANGAPENFDIPRAHALYQLLLGRFAPMLAGKRHVMIVATGALSSLPFHVLITELPRPELSYGEALKDAQWLIRRHALSVLPSVQSLSVLRKLAAAGVAVKPYFGMGDPQLGGAVPVPGDGRGKAKASVSLAALYRNGGAADLPLLQTLAPLPETAGELRKVARTLGASEDSVVVGQAATKDRLLAAPLQNYRILHFATHGLVAGDLSGLQEPALVLSLPPQSTKAEDALLTASEVATLRMNADWAVLSACNTASGDKVGADALSGLARAFFFAGARALLVSHWAVNSEAAVNLTTRTFGFLAQAPGLRRAEAFQRAMLTLIEEGNPPSYWAPFVIVGEGGTVLRKRG
jgi:CHAT domain-containing protein/tetratricopeptide (TPR) repeat protein